MRNVILVTCHDLFKNLLQARKFVFRESFNLLIFRDFFFCIFIVCLKTLDICKCSSDLLDLLLFFDYETLMTFVSLCVILVFFKSAFTVGFQKALQPRSVSCWDTFFLGQVEQYQSVVTGQQRKFVTGLKYLFLA